jgi:hypothetical protein
MAAAAAYALGGVEARTIPNETNVFRLRWTGSDGNGDASGELRVSATPAWTSNAGPVSLYRAGTRIDALSLPPDATEVPYDIGPAGRGFWYQVRAALPAGNFALSNPVWVPGRLIDDASVDVTIDAVPWARVRVIDAASGADMAVPSPNVTPLTLRLPQGEYLVDLENDGVTSRTQERMDVRGGTVNTFRYPMPGFDIDRLLAAAREAKK